MKILHFSDVHGNLSALEKILEIANSFDLIISTGDFLPYDQDDSILSYLKKFPKEKSLFIPGNIDNQSVVNFLENEGFSLHLKSKTFFGFSFAGIGGLIGTNGFYHYNVDYSRAKVFVDSLAKVDVLISHQPPFGTSIDLAFGNHIGSELINYAIEKLKPRVVLSGHAHGAKGYCKISKTICLNPGALKDGYYAVYTLTPDSFNFEFLEVD